MWIAKQMAQRRREQETGAFGTVTAPGAQLAAVTDTERRGLRLIAPGGIAWAPRTAQTVLLFQGTEDCVLGQEVSCEQTLLPGELCLYSDGASVTLKNNGEIHVIGTIFVNGRRISENDGE